MGSLATIRGAGYEAAAAAARRVGRDLALDGVNGFREVWEVVRLVPGFLEEVNAAVFFAVIAEAQPGSVVEIGSYLGRSTVLLGLALQRLAGSGARVTAIDPHTGDRQQREALGGSHLPSLDLFRVHIDAAGLAPTVDVVVDTSAAAGRTWDAPIDLLYVDGWHSYDAVRQDIQLFGPHLTDHALVCFDDFTQYLDVQKGVIDGCREAGLTLYGSVFGQAWGGRGGAPPRALRRVRRIGADFAGVARDFASGRARPRATPGGRSQRHEQRSASHC